MTWAIPGSTTQFLVFEDSQAHCCDPSLANSTIGPGKTREPFDQSVCWEIRPDALKKRSRLFTIFFVPLRVLAYRSIPYGSLLVLLVQSTKTHDYSRFSLYYLTSLSVPHGSLLVPFGSYIRTLTISKFITCCSFCKFSLCAGSSITNHIITAHVGVWMGSSALLGRHSLSRCLRL